MNDNALKLAKLARDTGYTWHDIAVVLDISESKLKRLVGCKSKPTLNIRDWPPYLEYLASQTPDPKSSTSEDPKPPTLEPSISKTPISEYPKPSLSEPYKSTITNSEPTREDLISRLELVNSNRANCESISTFEALVDMTESDKLDVFKKYAGKNFLEHLPDNYDRVDLMELLLEFCKENVIKYTGFPLQAKYIQKVEELEKILKTKANFNNSVQYNS